jgi:hypothetical protein
MRTHIDWITFTFTPEYTDNTPEGFMAALGNGLVTLLGYDVANLALGGAWERRERSRAPYTDAWDIERGGITVFASPNLTHACVEISGEGCERLICESLLNEVLTKCHERVTRIDIACDIQTKTTPTEFVAIVKHERMRSSGYQKSETGETCYVGSQKSDRYARVYKYAAPHPRANLLRIEHVFRREAAKKVSKACLESGQGSVATAAGYTFGWSHPDWKPDLDQLANISTCSAERKMGGTVFWLIKQCAPAFKRLVADGTIRDPDAFVRTYFLIDTI